MAVNVSEMRYAWAAQCLREEPETRQALAALAMVVADRCGMGVDDVAAEIARACAAIIVDYPDESHAGQWQDIDGEWHDGPDPDEWYDLERERRAS